MSYTNRKAFNITTDSQGRNILTAEEDGTDVYFKMLEIYEVDCLKPAKQPEIPKPKWDYKNFYKSFYDMPIIFSFYYILMLYIWIG